MSHLPRLSCHIARTDEEGVRADGPAAALGDHEERPAPGLRRQGK